MANVKREIQIKLLNNGFVKGKFINKRPLNRYFKKNSQHIYEVIEERTAFDIFTKMGWEIPEDLLHREGKDKGGRPRKK